VSAAGKFPLLSNDEEQALSLRWRDHHDTRAAQQLIGSHLRLVIKTARSYRGYGLPLDDLYGEGQVGLMRALCRFDPDCGVRFATYALWWIRSEIQGYILRSWSLVKLGTTASQKKLFFNLRKTRHYLQIMTQAELRPEDVTRIASILDVSEDEVVSMDQRMSSPDVSLNVLTDADEQGDWQSRLVDHSEGQESVLSTTEETARRKVLFSSAFSKLSPREQHIIAERHLREAPATLADLSQHHSISKERVRQIECRAVAKLEKFVRNSQLTGRRGMMTNDLLPLPNFVRAADQGLRLA
jgi:RNA polymerase sigma-32 factor